MNNLIKVLRYYINNSDFASDRYRYLAIDKNGEVFAYEVKPVYDTIKECYDIDLGKARRQVYTCICNIGPIDHAVLYNLLDNKEEK